jgi:hypothetical protein
MTHGHHRDALSGGGLGGFVSGEGACQLAEAAIPFDPDPRSRGPLVRRYGCRIDFAAGYLLDVLRDTHQPVGSNASEVALDEVTGNGVSGNLCGTGVTEQRRDKGCCLGGVE